MQPRDTKIFFYTNQHNISDDSIPSGSVYTVKFHSSTICHTTDNLGLLGVRTRLGDPRLLFLGRIRERDSLNADS